MHSFGSSVLDEIVFLSLVHTDSRLHRWKGLLWDTVAYEQTDAQCTDGGLFMVRRRLSREASASLQHRVKVELFSHSKWTFPVERQRREWKHCSSLDHEQRAQGTCDFTWLLPPSLVTHRPLSATLTLSRTQQTALSQPPSIDSLSLTHFVRQKGKSRALLTLIIYWSVKMSWPSLVVHLNKFIQLYPTAHWWHSIVLHTCRRLSEASVPLTEATRAWWAEYSRRVLSSIERFSSSWTSHLRKGRCGASQHRHTDRQTQTHSLSAVNSWLFNCVW